MGICGYFRTAIPAELAARRTLFPGAEHFFTQRLPDGWIDPSNFDSFHQFKSVIIFINSKIVIFLLKIGFFIELNRQIHKEIN